jgi:membrane associated rhomboid family serine protease
MFIIPVGNRVDWKRPPVVTLLIILANSFVFFFLQAGNEQQDSKAYQYYFSSDLPIWELNRYQVYLDANQDYIHAQKIGEYITKKDANALTDMERDVKFMRDLHAGHVVTQEMPEYEKWTSQRSEYESMQSFTTRYVFHSDDPHLITELTSIFMHANFEHLFGNMMVLFLVGFIAESVVGKSLFLLAYIVSGFAGHLMFSLTLPGYSSLGASGAIAGMMGLYAVIFGLKKIDFFYQIGFYFDYVRAPAIALLPLWLGNEAYQFMFNKDSHIGYMAHFGGLIGGAMMGFTYLLFRSRQIKSNHEEVESRVTENLIFQRGMELLGMMEFKKALREFNMLREKHPNDTNLLLVIYRAAKFNPSSEDYHQAAIRLLTNYSENKETTEKIHSIFQEYSELSKPFPRLSSELIVNLAKKFSLSGHSDDAEKLLFILLAMEPTHKELPKLLLAIAYGFLREKRKDRLVETVQTLRRKYPHSSEAEAAASYLPML